LKDTKIISYQISVEPTNEGPCGTDLNALNKAVDLVANQSLKLKLLREQDHLEQAGQLSDGAKKASGKAIHDVIRRCTDNGERAG
jgi:hypothetical protein